jgi:protein involved in sex pheromone biosynthesis
MAFPSLGGSKQDNLSAAWESVRGLAASVKSRATSLRSQAAAGSIPSVSILNFAGFMANVKDAFNRAASINGMAAYAQEQIGDNTVDIVAEFTAMTAQVSAVIQWVIDNFPKDGSGFLLATTLDANGREQQRLFTTAQTATFRTALNGLIAAID